MAIFSKKTENEENKVVEDTTVVNDVQATAVVVPVGKNKVAVMTPRMSEKATNLEKLNKYIFRIDGKANKLEIRKSLEKAYGVKIDRINIVTVKSRSRRYGRTSGRIGAFKKAVVTLKPDSKKIEIAEAV